MNGFQFRFQFDEFKTNHNFPMILLWSHILHWMHRHTQATLHKHIVYSVCLIQIINQSYHESLIRKLLLILQWNTKRIKIELFLLRWQSRNECLIRIFIVNDFCVKWHCEIEFQFSTTPTWISIVSVRLCNASWVCSFLHQSSAFTGLELRWWKIRIVFSFYVTPFIEIGVPKSMKKRAWINFIRNENWNLGKTIGYGTNVCLLNWAILSLFLHFFNLHFNCGYY